MCVEPRHVSIGVGIVRRHVSTVGAVGDEPREVVLGRDRDTPADGHTAPLNTPRGAIQRRDVGLVESGWVVFGDGMLRRHGADLGQPGQPPDAVERAHRAGVLPQMDQDGELYTVWELRPTVDRVVCQDGHPH